jgi:hypothetical protein
MGEVQKPQAGVGGAYQQGNNPRPGGEVDTPNAPPYEGRSSGPNDTESTRAKTDSVERQLEDTPGSQPERTESPGGTNVDPSTGKDGKPVSAGEVSHQTPADPHGVGSSSSMKGEDYADPATEHKGATNRPVGQVEGDLMEPNNSGSGTSDVN